MESDNAVIGALIFLALVVGANLVMYGIARGWAKSGGSDWLNAFRKGLGKSIDSGANKSIDELHQKMEDLRKNAKDN